MKFSSQRNDKTKDKPSFANDKPTGDMREIFSQAKVCPYNSTNPCTLGLEPGNVHICKNFKRYLVLLVLFAVFNCFILLFFFQLAAR